jgi:hypothetical protein
LSTVQTTVPDFGFYRIDDTWQHPIVNADLEFSVSSVSTATLHDAILHSHDKLFFVRYMNEGTFRARWYLISVDLEQTQEASVQYGDPSVSGIYYVHFYARHPSDKDLSDAAARWWPEWHQYTTDSAGVINYGKRILFSPSVVPDPDKCIAWADTVNLQDPAVRLLGPFDFAPPHDVQRSKTPSYRQHIPETHWVALTEICVSSGVVPPQLFVSVQAPRGRKLKQTKRNNTAAQVAKRQRI